MVITFLHVVQVGGASVFCYYNSKTVYYCLFRLVYNISRTFIVPYGVYTELPNGLSMSDVKARVFPKKLKPLITLPAQNPLRFKGSRFFFPN